MATIYCPNSPKRLLEKALLVKSAPNSNESPVIEIPDVFSLPSVISTEPLKGYPS